jgi:hypothetical protein
MAPHMKTALVLAVLSVSLAASVPTSAASLSFSSEGWCQLTYSGQVWGGTCDGTFPQQGNNCWNNGDTMTYTHVQSVTNNGPGGHTYDSQLGMVRTWDNNVQISLDFHRFIAQGGNFVFVHTVSMTWNGPNAWCGVGFIVTYRLTDIATPQWPIQAWSFSA